MRAAISERTTDCNNAVRDDVGRLIYLYLIKNDFFRHFTGEGLSCLDIRWCAYMDAICKEDLFSNRNFLYIAGK